MASYLPGVVGGSGSTATAWINRVWNSEIDVQAYEESVVMQQITDMQAPHGMINVPLHNNLGTNTLGGTDNGNNLTFSSNTETAVTATPGTSYCAVEVNKNVTVRAVTDPDQALRRSISMALAAKIDTDVCTLISSLTTNIVGDSAQNIDKGMILDAEQKLASGAKMYFKPGVTNGICVVGATQIDDLLNISDITNAQFRGDSANPVVEGWFSKAFGLIFYETGNVSTASATLWNMAFIPRFAGIGFNQRPTVIAESYQLVDRIIAWADYAYTTIRDAYSVAIKTTTA